MICLATSLASFMLMGEPDALSDADDYGVDPNHLGTTVDQRSPAVAGIDRGVGLDQIDDRGVMGRIDRALQGADDSLADRGSARQSHRVTDGDNVLPDHQRGRVSKPRRLKSFDIPYLDDGEVCNRVLAYHLGLVVGAVVECDCDALAGLHDVIVGEYVSFRGENDAGRGAIRRKWSVEQACGRELGRDVDDRRREQLDYLGGWQGDGRRE